MSGYPQNLYDGHAPHEAPGTSYAAALSIEAQSETLRADVLRAIIASRAAGMTDDEIELKLTLRHQTASARRRELVLLGFVQDSGRRRDTSSGRQATVWISVAGQLELFHEPRP